MPNYPRDEIEGQPQHQENESDRRLHLHPNLFVYLIFGGQRHSEPGGIVYSCLKVSSKGHR